MDYLTLKKEVAAVLQDVPNHTIPLFKFREMFEKRYRRSVSTSDLYRMRDVVQIMDNSNPIGLGGRTISLSPDWSIKGGDGLDVFCPMHPPSLHSGFPSTRLGWAEKEVGVMLPNVEMEFRILSSRIGSILDSHHGEVPLFSFLDCYGAEFGGIQRMDDGSGVPLEHLIASVNGIQISYAENGMKKIQWKGKAESESGFPGLFYDPMGLQLAQLSRELVDLLKTFPRCSISFSKLIPAYHHHFGRQCRVSDYGHVNLSSLLQTLPMTIQVIGEGPSRIIMLAHRAQMKRFASDVFRVLKSQPGVKKQVRLVDFPQAYAVTFPSKTFCPEDYGLCFFSDLVSELVEFFAMVTLTVGEDGEEYLAIPKKEQTPLEVQKTRVFAAEVVELLGHSIRCEMPFFKFIPSYHHHFGRQCRVADFGFTKLAELFDSISETVTCENLNPGVDSNIEDKILRLTPREQIKVVGGQIRGVIERRMEKGLLTRLGELDDIFISEHGFALRVDLCGASDLRNLLMHWVAPWVKLDGDIIRIPTDTESRLATTSSHLMTGDELISSYAEAIRKPPSQLEVDKNIGQLSLLSSVTNEELDTKIRQIQVFGEEMSALLEESGGYLGIQSIPQVYETKYGRPLVPENFGCSSLIGLLQSISDVATLRGKFRTRRALVLNKVISNGHRTGHGVTDNRNHNNGHNNNNNSSGGGAGGTFHGKFAGSAQEQGGIPWNALSICIPPSPQQNLSPPMFSPMLPSPSFTSRDTNVFNFEQATALSAPVYDMWMGDGTNQGSPPPLSPSILWTYHPFCYQPAPGSPNMLIPSFAYGPWSSPPQPMMSSPCFNVENYHQPAAQ